MTSTKVHPITAFVREALSQPASAEVRRLIALGMAFEAKKAQVEAGSTQAAGRWWARRWAELKKQR